MLLYDQLQAMQSAMTHRMDILLSMTDDMELLVKAQTAEIAVLTKRLMLATAVCEAADRCTDCISEFDADLACCGEYFQHLDIALEAWRAQEEK